MEQQKMDGLIIINCLYYVPYRIDMDSAEFVQELKPFLLQTTEHFVHELLSFAKAPFDLIAYDENVVYPWPEESSRNTISRDRNNIREEREGMTDKISRSCHFCLFFFLGGGGRWLYAARWRGD